MHPYFKQNMSGMGYPVEINTVKSRRCITYQKLVPGTVQIPDRQAFRPSPRHWLLLAHVTFHRQPPREL